VKLRGNQEEKDALYLRLRNLRPELKRRGIPRDLWDTMQDYAETWCDTMSKLEEYLDQMEVQRGGQYS